jgi:hypothetical protein
MYACQYTEIHTQERSYGPDGVRVCDGSPSITSQVVTIRPNSFTITALRDKRGDGRWSFARDARDGASRTALWGIGAIAGEVDAD